MQVTIGSHTAGEVAGTGTNLSDYGTVIGGDCAADGSVSLAAGDVKVCTITNTRHPILSVTKILDPPTDPGLFNLRIDGSIEAANVGNGGTTGPVVVSIGSHSVDETAGTGTDLLDFVSVIGGDCAADGSVSLAAGDVKACTITNTRIAECQPGFRVVSVTLEVTALGSSPIDLDVYEKRGQQVIPVTVTPVVGSIDAAVLGTTFTVTPLVGPEFETQNLRFSVDGEASKSLKVHLSCSDDPFVGQTHSGDGVTLTKTAFTAQ